MRKKSSSWFIKSNAFFVLISFTLLNVSINPVTSYAQPVSTNSMPGRVDASKMDPMAILGSLKVPEELGSIQETYSPMSLRANGVSEAIPEIASASLGSPPRNDGRLVIYLQDAHTNYDAETNIRKLIHLFQKEYHLNLVFLEGGEGKLDSLFFKSFPDGPAKEKILNDYVSKGELSGGEIASVLNEDYDTDYYGIETQALYNENKSAFLKASQKQEEISRALGQIESQFKEQSTALFSDSMRTFAEKKEAFRREEIDLMEYLKALKGLHSSLRGSTSDKAEAISEIASSALRPPRNDVFSASFPELSKILTADSNEQAFRNENVDSTMTLWLASFKQKILPKLPKEKQMQVNQMIQLHQLGQLAQGMLVKHIEELSREFNFSMKTPEALKPTAKHARTVSSIKGTKLFEELESLEENLRNTLPKTEAERTLARNFHELEILKAFSRLEIVHKDWQSLKNKKPSELLTSVIARSPVGTTPVGQAADGRLVIWHRAVGSAKQSKSSEIASTSPDLLSRNDDRLTSLDSLFADHFRFYELATERDEALFENIVSAMKKQKAKLSLVVTGGFHSEGITEKLKSQGIPFILIAPKINQIGDMANYYRVMEGKASYMQYFKGSLWDALAQDYAAKLAKSLKEEDLTPSLKRWRDRIIQNSIAEGKITQAGDYTKYVDALVQALRKEFEGGAQFDALSEAQLKKKLEAELNSFLSTYFEKMEALVKAKLDVFSSGFKELWEKGNVNPKAVGELLDRVSSVKTSNLAVAIPLIKEEESTVRRVLSQHSQADQQAILNFVRELLSENGPQYLKNIFNIANGLDAANIPADAAEFLRLSRGLTDEQKTTLKSTVEQYVAEAEQGGVKSPQEKKLSQGMKKMVGQAVESAGKPSTGQITPASKLESQIPAPKVAQPSARAELRSGEKAIRIEDIKTQFELLGRLLDGEEVVVYKGVRPGMDFEPGTPLVTPFGYFLPDTDTPEFNIIRKEHAFMDEVQEKDASLKRHPRRLESVFLAPSISEARRWGSRVYEVRMKAKPEFLKTVMRGDYFRYPISWLQLDAFTYFSERFSSLSLGGLKGLSEEILQEAAENYLESEGSHVNSEILADPTLVDLVVGEQVPPEVVEVALQEGALRAEVREISDEEIAPILAKIDYKIEDKFAVHQSYQLYAAAQNANLTFEEHVILFDYLWHEYSGLDYSMLPGLRDKIIRSKPGILYMAAIGHLEGGLFPTLKSLKLTTEEENFFWQVFHDKFPKASNRPDYLIKNQTVQSIVDKIRMSITQLEYWISEADPKGMP